MNPNGLTNEQIKQGYSTVPGNFNPVTGQLNTTITADSLKPQPTVDLSPSFTPQPDLVTPTLAGAANNQTAFQNDYQRFLDLQNQNQDNSLAKMIASVTGDIEGLQGRGAAQQQAENQLGINQFNQTLAALSSQRGSKLAELNQSLAQQRAEQAQLEAGAGAKGLTTSMLGGQQAALARVREAENQTRAAEIGLLDAQILGGQGQLKAAQDAANRAVDLMFQDREATVNTKLKQIELYTPLFNASEKKKADALTFALNNEQKKLEEEKDNLKAVQNLIVNASGQGAPQDLLQRASKAKTAGEASMILGGYSGDYIGNKIKMAQANAQATKTGLEIEKLRKELSQSDQDFSTANLPNTPAGFVQKLLTTANKDKQLDATERNQLSKMKSVISQIGSLQVNLQQNNKTGFIKGRVNNLLTNLNLNPDISEINAQITALIPNVARGVYGEVGVLTDADIKNYKGTLANITNSKDQNDAVLALTLRNAMKSYESILNTAANSGINVSGWAKDYNEITKRVYEIEDRIGVSKKGVQNLVAENPDLLKVVEEMYTNGLSDGDILTSLNAR